MAIAHLEEVRDKISETFGTKFYNLNPSKFPELAIAIATASTVIGPVTIVNTLMTSAVAYKSKKKTKAHADVLFGYLKTCRKEGLADDLTEVIQYAYQQKCTKYCRKYATIFPPGGLVVMGVQIFHAVKKRFLKTKGTERNKSAKSLLMYARAERRRQTVAEENMAIDVITELMSSHEYAERIIAKNDHKKLADKLKTT